MNAVDQAIGFDRVSKIAAVTNLFCLHFPETSVDFLPWLDTTETRKFDDLNSIDIAFNFTNQRYCRSQSVLLQIQLPRNGSSSNSSSSNDRPLNIEIAGYGNNGVQWQFSTNGGSEFWGTALPSLDDEIKLREIFHWIIDIFKVDVSHTIN